MDYKVFFKKDLFAASNGIELEVIEPGYAVSTLTVEERHLNAGGNAQGGALFTMADLALGAAANANGVPSVSVQCDIRYLIGVPLGSRLRAIAKEVVLRKTLCHYRVEIFNQDDELVAVADGICFRKNKS